MSLGENVQGGNEWRMGKLYETFSKGGLCSMFHNAYFNNIYDKSRPIQVFDEHCLYNFL